jgi:hypothetical protein
MVIGCLDKHGWLEEWEEITPGDDSVPSLPPEGDPLSTAANDRDGPKTERGPSPFERGARKICGGILRR